MIKKNDLVLLIAIILILSSACGRQQKNSEYEGSSEMDIIASSNENVIHDEPINHVTDYVGPYVNSDNETMTMFLSAEPENGASVSVTEDDVVWIIKGKYNDSSKTITYTDGIKKRMAEDNNETVEYSDGEGEFIINENDTIEWNDLKDNKKMTFHFASEDHE